MNKHPYHLVDPSPWPFIGSGGALLLVSGLARWMNNYEKYLWFFGFIVILITSFQWWRDVRRESVFQGIHTQKVENGLRIGMVLFIISEIFLFFRFFWAFFHSSLRPNVEIGSIWPPTSVEPISPFQIPLLNTTILLTRGATITWAHSAILVRKWAEANIRLLLTVVLGIIFSSLQLGEYLICNFTMSDSVYGRSFFLATGFHGVHVLIGTLFIFIIWLRLLSAHYSEAHHFGLEARAWYWHFVDVVWLFLFMCIYWWRS